MKRTGNVIMNGFTKVIGSRHKKRIAAAAVAVVLTAVVVTTSLFNRAAQAAENADTLMGIEKLRNEFSDGAEYTVLEIVPDINAAEIGYLFDGYEPILSKWDSETMTWKSWKDILCGMSEKEERKAFIDGDPEKGILGKKAELQAYYDAHGLKDKVPVAISDVEYDDSEDYKEGYEKVVAGSYEKTGYFTPTTGNTGAFHVSFTAVGHRQGDDDTAHYSVKTIESITSESTTSNIVPGTYIYKLDGSYYRCVGTWESVKASGVVYPNPDQEETGDDNKDDKGDGTDKEDGNDVGAGDNGNEDETGNGDNGNGDEAGDGDGDNGNEAGTGNGDDGNGNEAGTGNGDDGNGNEAGTGNSDSSNEDENNAGNDDAAGSQSVMALKKSASDVKWLKYIGSDAPSNDEAESGSGSGDSSESGQNNSSGGANDSNDNDQSSDPSGETGTAGDNNGAGDFGNGAGDGAGDSSDGAGDGTGDLGNDNGDGADDSGNNNEDVKDDSNPNNGDGNSENEQDGDGAGEEDGNKEDNTDDDSDAKPGNDDKDSDKDLDKDPNKGSITTQDVGRAQNDTYWLVYFERSEDGEYIVDEETYPIMPAKYGSYVGEPDHPTGQYNFETEKEGNNIQTYTFPGRVLYCKGVFHNNEWFKQYVINMDKENFDKFKVKVITLTPKMLNSVYETEGSIPDFNFLYLNSGLRQSKIDIIGSSDEDKGDENTPAPAPDIEEGNDNGDDTVNDNTGDNDDTNNTGDGDTTEDNGTAGDGGTTEDNGTAGDGGTTEDNGTAGDDATTEDNGTADNNIDDGTTEGKDDAGSTGDDGINEEKDNTDNSADDGSNTGNVSASSLWKAFVSTDDSVDASKSEVVAETETSNNEDNIDVVDEINNNDANAGDTENDVTSDDAGSNDDTTGDTNDDTSTDDNGNMDGNIGDGAEPDKSEEGDGEGADDEKDSSIGSDNNSDSLIVLYSTDSDLSPDVANALFNRVSSKALPCLVDGSIIYGKADVSGAISDKFDNTTHTELFRLAAMLCQETLKKDYTSVTSKQVLLDGIVDADKNFTTDQVYCRLGNGSDSIINDNFFNYTIYKEGGDVEAGFQNVLDEIKLENLYRASDSSGKYKPLPTNISQAEAIRHILNYQNRRNEEPKKSIKVLEIQPAYTTEPELTEKQIKKWAPGVEEVETTIMTTAEFIGKIDKLNEIYDLIYIGTSKEHLNISNWVTNTGKSRDNKYLGSTVFNDSDMDGLIYYNVGDKRVVNLPMSGLLDSEYKNGRTYYYNFARYSGNDITKEKEDALISFLNGSYPIIVSDDFIEQPVTVFENDNYAGRRATLNVGVYKEADLLDNQIFVGIGTPTEGISSIQVKKGYQITLFEDDNFEGDSFTFTEDVNSFTTSSARLADGQTWNNRCRSAIVEKIEGVESVRALDGNHIDNSSYLYDFAYTALKKKYNNFFVRGDIDNNNSELLKFYLNRPKASLADFATSGTTSGSVDGTSAAKDVNYIYPNTIGRYTLQYSFTIKNEGAASMDTRYNCKLYIDVNADGKFSEFEEVSDIVMTNRQNGGVVSSNELYAGVPYLITREVPNGYKGLLPWKVEVCQVNNDNIYASETGYTKLYGMGKETLKICQINKNTDNKWRVIDLSYEIEDPDDKGRYFNILVHGGDYEGVHYEGIDKEFELDVETINISKFESYYNPSSPDYNPDYLKDFNMLILGFSDAYDDFSGVPTDANTPLGAVIEFINSGKSVLMGHDNTSYWNNPDTDGVPLGYTKRDDKNGSSLEGLKKNTRFAANINKYIRPLVGMDRYGVLSSPVVKRGVSLKEGAAGWNELFTSGKEIAYKPKSARKETVPEAQGFTNVIINVRDTDSSDAEKHEFSKYSLYSGDYSNRSDFTNTYVNQRFDDCYYDDKTKDNGEINSANTSGKVKNVYVTQVNQGQITEYPYKLDDKFEVAQTHAQYYQLDYTADDDGDGQSDLVVWYCLGGRDLKSTNKEKQTTIYSQSPNDVRNNYYIYNKGNITYSGLGHGANDNSDKNDNKAGYTFEEAKLFINTIIASYQAGVKPPTVTVLDSGRSDASQLTTMYRYYDNQHEISITDLANKEDYEKVYFTVRDINFVKGSRVIATKAYYHNNNDDFVGSEEISVDGETIAVNSLDNDKMYYAENDMHVDSNNLISGEIYYILVPKTEISKCEKGLDIYFEAQSTIKTNTTTENVYTTDKVYAKLQVLRAYLFELD